MSNTEYCIGLVFALWMLFLGVMDARKDKERE